MLRFRHVIQNYIAEELIRIAAASSLISKKRSPLLGVPVVPGCASVSRPEPAITLALRSMTSLPAGGGTVSFKKLL